MYRINALATKSDYARKWNNAKGDASTLMHIWRTNWCTNEKGQDPQGPGLVFHGAGNRIRTCNRQFTKLLRYRCVIPARYFRV